MRGLSGLSARWTVLSLAGAAVAMLATLEWIYDLEYSLGILYVLPVTLAATVLSRWQVFAAAVACAYIRGRFDIEVTPVEHGLRFCMATIAYSSCGLLVSQITMSRRRMLTQYARIRFEQKLRHRAEEQLRLLAESSPAAILTMSGEGTIIAANRAAHEMLGLAADESLLQRPVDDFFPLFRSALSLSTEIDHVRTWANTWARRQDCSSFPATTWFSIYGAGAKRSLAAIVVDTSEEVRDRERAHFEQLANHHQVLAGAVSHEIRNLCSAIAVVGSNLDRQQHLAGDPDFVALKNLIEALTRLASFDLRKRQRINSVEVSLPELLREFHIIVETDWTDSGGKVIWSLPDDLPRVLADPQSLLQVLLNLSQNALRASDHSERKELHVDASLRGDLVSIRVRDTGPGMSDTSHLFQPFRPGSDGSGLGLYVSREMVRSFSGELQYIPTDEGCCFEITVPIAVEPGEQA